MKKIVIFIAMAIATLSVAQAQTVSPAPAPLHFLAGIGVSAGGEELANVHYTNGSSQTIRAGGGVYFTGGLDYRISPEFSLQATANFHVDDTHARNGSIRFQRFPLELLGYYHAGPQWRVGGGVRYVTNAKLTSSGDAAGPDYKFDNSTSAVVEVEYFWTPKFGMKVRYVNEPLKAYGQDVRGNHVGISGNFYF
jgi:opacity protein-like surface antigen